MTSFDYPSFKAHFVDLLRESAKALIAPGDAVPIELVRTKQANHGDYSCNLAMQLAKPLHKSPREIASLLINALPTSPYLDKVEIAGAGFIKTLFNGSTDINIVGTPTEISADQNNQTLKPSVVKGSFCATASSYKICGKITREDNVAIPNVIIMLSGGKSATATTNTNGEYFFENLDANLNYTVKPFKNTDHKNGMNGGDVTAIRKHILATEKLNSPYKIIAADAISNNTVNGGDLTEVRKLILALINQFTSNTSWVFVPTSHNFSNPQNPLSTSFPASITFNSLNIDQMTTDFVGIKIGDVNLSNTPSNMQESTASRSLNEITIILGLAAVSSNQQFDIPISVRQFQDITNGQFSINWNANYNFPILMTTFLLL